MSEADSGTARPLRVAIFEPYLFDSMSGNQRFIGSIFTLIDRSVVEPILAGLRWTTFSEAISDAGSDVDVVPAPPILSTHGGELTRTTPFGKIWIAVMLVPYWIRIGFWLKRKQADVLECNSPRAVIMAGPPAKLLGIPILLYSKGHLTTPILDGFVLKAADRVLFQGPKIRDRSYPKLIERIRKKVFVLENGIDLTEVEAALADPARVEALKTSIGALPDRINFGIAGQISERRGVDRAIKAIATLQQQGIACRLFVIGDYMTKEFVPYYERCRSLVRELGVTGVEFVGFRSDAVAVMAAMDVVILPSRDESVPKAILEGMALGKPVVVTDVGSVLDAVGPQEGFVVPMDDAEALVTAMGRLAKDPALRASMGQAGRAHALKSFDIVRNIRGFEQHLLEVAKLRGRIN